MLGLLVVPEKIEQAVKWCWQGHGQRVRKRVKDRGTRAVKSRDALDLLQTEPSVESDYMTLAPPQFVSAPMTFQSKPVMQVAGLGELTDGGA